MKPSTYSVIYADPPWKYHGGRLHKEHYPRMSLDALCEMDDYVKSISARDCLLFLWVTGPKIPDALTLLRAWGFEYVTVAFVWNKHAPIPGAYTMSQTEQCWVGKRRGGTMPQRAAHELQYLGEHRREHSQKPDEIRDRIARMFPAEPKIELFARSRHQGWDAHGNEVGKFSAPESEPASDLTQ